MREGEGGKGEYGTHLSTSGPYGSNTDVLKIHSTYLVVGEVASIPAGGRGVLETGSGSMSAGRRLGEPRRFALGGGLSLVKWREEDKR